MKREKIKISDELETICTLIAVLLRGKTERALAEDLQNMLGMRIAENQITALSKYKILYQDRKPRASTALIAAICCHFNLKIPPEFQTNKGSAASKLTPWHSLARSNTPLAIKEMRLKITSQQIEDPLELADSLIALLSLVLPCASFWTVSRLEEKIDSRQVIQKIRKVFGDDLHRFRRWVALLTHFQLASDAEKQAISSSVLDLINR